MRRGFLCRLEVMRMSKNQTNDNIYRPTPAEKKLLEVLVSPENTGKSVHDLCNLANISRFKYYQAMKKPDFVKLVNETTLELIKGKVSDILNASYTFALTEKGFQDRKILLQMAGLLVEKTETTINGSLDISESAKEIEQYFSDGDTS